MPDFNSIVARLVPKGWPVVSSNAGGAALDAQKAAVVGQCHIITGFSISFGAATTIAVTLLVKSGTGVLDRYELPIGFVGPFARNYETPFRCASNDIAQAVTSGSAGGIAGTLVLLGFSVNADV